MHTDVANVVRRYFDAVNAHDANALEAVACERLAMAIQWFTAGNPDLHFDVEWLAVDGDKVTAWVYGEGTHSGHWTFPTPAGAHAFQPLPPTNKRWRAACSATYLVVGERIEDFWVSWDWLAILDQLGAVSYRTPADDGPSRGPA